MRTRDGVGSIADDAMRAFVEAMADVEGTAPTWCMGWSAHEVVAHVTAAAHERADLIEEHLSGRPPRPTRSWEEREPPFRALHHERLRERLVAEALRFEHVVAAMDAADSIEYTGWTMTADRLRTHSRSEAVLHRWDLVGHDEASRRRLSDPALTGHAVAVFAGIPALVEAERWIRAPFGTAPVRLRSSGQPDLLVESGSGLVLRPATGVEPVIEIDAADRLLLLWGRYPPALRPIRGNPESIDDLLHRICP